VSRNAVIKFANVYKAFPKGSLALKDVSFHISRASSHSSPGIPAPANPRDAADLRGRRADAGEVRVSGISPTRCR